MATFSAALPEEAEIHYNDEVMWQPTSLKISIGSTLNPIISLSIKNYSICKHSNRKRVNKDRSTQE
jgi:hypothetical protein